MNQVLESYMIAEQYERVRAFNHTPQQFDFEAYTQWSIADFREKQNAMREAEERLREDEKIEGQKSLGPQKHSKPDRKMVPGGEHFILDEIKKVVDR